MAPVTFELRSTAYNLRVDIGGKIRNYTLPAELIQKAHGHTFLLLQKSHHALRRCLAVQSEGGGRQSDLERMAMLNSSDTIERIHSAKHTALYDFLVGPSGDCLLYTSDAADE